jgi:hypothetical protein
MTESAREAARAEFEKFQTEVRKQFPETIKAKMPSGEYLLPRLNQDWELWQAAIDRHPGYQEMNEALLDCAHIARQATTFASPQWRRDALGTIERAERILAVSRVERRRRNRD